MPEKTPDPDQATIEVRCQEVQATWTPKERARRFVGRELGADAANVDGVPGCGEPVPW